MEWANDFEKLRGPVYTDDELWRKSEMDCKRLRLGHKTDPQEIHPEINELIFAVLADETGEWRMQYLKDAQERWPTSRSTNARGRNIKQRPRNDPLASRGQHDCPGRRDSCARRLHPGVTMAGASNVSHLRSRFGLDGSSRRETEKRGYDPEELPARHRHRRRARCHRQSPPSGCVARDRVAAASAIAFDSRRRD